MKKLSMKKLSDNYIVSGYICGKDVVTKVVSATSETKAATAFARYICAKYRWNEVDNIHICSLKSLSESLEQSLVEDQGFVAQNSDTIKDYIIDDYALCL
jgi:hypothetical protein